MTIRIPDSLRDAEINIGVEIPQPEISIEKNKDGSMSLSAHYDMCDISEFAWHVANELNDDIEKALIENLLELNGYIKEITCEFYSQACGKRRCKRCGAFVSVDSVWDCSSLIPVRYCPNCGAKVIGG